MPRRRTLHVCVPCHDRKVRCDLDATGTPCSNCRDRHLDCTLRTRQPYRATNRTKKNDKVRSNEVRPDAEDAANIPNPIYHIDQTRIVSSVITQPGARTASIYIGESGYGALLDELRPPGSSVRHHVTINGTEDAALSREDLEYLQLKGCFQLPVNSDKLFEAYFDYVHPLFPVLDGPSVLRQHADGGLNSMNLLLLWSMFSASASYVPEYANKETKAVFVMRGKLLFHLSSENDKLVLIQSAHLLSFWFDDAEDVKQSWYWSGIAFNVAQTLGLHRVPLPKQDPCISVDIWRNVWHFCLLRDAWLSYSMGRPLRLSEVEQYATLPSITNCQFRTMQLHGKNLYSEVEADGFEKGWRDSITTAMALRRTLLPKPSGSLSSQSVYLCSDSEISQNRTSSIRLSLCYHHLRLCREAARIASAQQRGVEEDAETAADGIVATIKSYQRDEATSHVPLMVVPLIMPAMLVSISSLKSNESQSRKLGEGRLACCLDLLDAIEQTYPAASIVKKLFCAANDTIRARYYN